MKKLCIVGGGTAGWITLSYLAATTDLDLTIIHSNEIDIIGVGESTTPAIRHVAQTVGLDESIWMKDSKATYKLGIDFQNWQYPGSAWFHSFDDQLPHQSFGYPLTQNGKVTYKKELTSIEYFLSLRKNDPKKYNIRKFNEFHGCYQYLLDHKLSPNSSEDIVNIGTFPGHAYHINAYEFGQSLRKHTTSGRYTEIVATVINVEHNETGITKLKLNDGREITADIYYDCSGFYRLLSSKLTEYQVYEDLINDSAIFGNVKGKQSYKPATEAIAQNSGWIWAIPTVGQIGSGHVYSSGFMDEQTAIDIIVDYWAKQGLKYEVSSSVKFRGGRLRDIAIKNLISAGLNQSFIEPLEATSVMHTCITAIEFAKQYNKHNCWNEKSSRILNKVMCNLLEHTRDFVRYHYELSDRIDSEYWRYVRRPEALQEVCDIIACRVKKDTLLNGFNWASMLVGYDKPYLNKLPKITDRQLDQYLYYVTMMKQHYEYLVKDNLTIEQRLKNING